jgi:chromosome segregation ATPase
MANVTFGGIGTIKETVNINVLKGVLSTLEQKIIPLKADFHTAHNSYTKGLAAIRNMSNKIEEVRNAPASLKKQPTLMALQIAYNALVTKMGEITQERRKAQALLSKAVNAKNELKKRIAELEAAKATQQEAQKVALTEYKEKEAAKVEQQKQIEQIQATGIINGAYGLQWELAKIDKAVSEGKVAPQTVQSAIQGAIDEKAAKKTHRTVHGGIALPIYIGAAAVTALLMLKG